MQHDINFSIFAQGKLLLTSEYGVLDGALALALPTKFGQRLEVFRVKKQGDLPTLAWKSLDSNGNTWFEGHFRLSTFEVLSCSDTQVGQSLKHILSAAKKINPSFLSLENSLEGRTTLDFPRDWGLGSSSTLVASIAAWAEVSPYPLLAESFGGSGYDLACAFAEGPILYQRDPITQAVAVENAAFKPVFSQHLFFVHLGKKQDSRAGIAQYRQGRVGDAGVLAKKLSILTQAVLRSVDLAEFCHHLRVHEAIIGQVLGVEPIGKRLFSDFKGQVKSLGAWGGDFCLVAAENPDEVSIYFSQKGYPTVLAYADMIR